MTFWPCTLVDYAQIASALGTCGAVVVALYLSNRRPKPKLTISASQSMIVGGYGQAPWPQFLSVTVTNIGAMPAKINSIYWRPRRRTRLIGYQDFSGISPLYRNKPFPLVLEPGDSENLLISLDDPENWLSRLGDRGFFPEILKSRRALDRVRICAFTTVGSVSVGRVSKELLDSIWTAQRNFFVRSAVSDADRSDDATKA